MPDILVRGMEMPKTCFKCPLSFMKGERLFCSVMKEEVLRGKIAPECPIVVLPTHGDLISKQTALAALYSDYAYAAMDVIEKEVPVIVPAERRNHK